MTFITKCVKPALYNVIITTISSNYCITITLMCLLHLTATDKLKQMLSGWKSVSNWAHTFSNPGFWAVCLPGKCQPSLPKNLCTYVLLTDTEQQPVQLWLFSNSHVQRWSYMEAVNLCQIPYSWFYDLLASQYMVSYIALASFGKQRK